MIRRVLLILILLFLIATARLFVWPSTRTPTRADAVVMFVGGRGERLNKALDLMHAGAAPNLVIPNGMRPTWPEANKLCRGPTLFKVWCPAASPDSTRGEVRAIATLAAEQKWVHVVAVTSRYHVTRAHLLLSRCFHGLI